MAQRSLRSCPFYQSSREKRKTTSCSLSDEPRIHVRFHAVAAEAKVHANEAFSTCTTCCSQRTLHLRDARSQGRPVVAQDKEDGEIALDMARTTTMATPPWTGQLVGNTTRPSAWQYSRRRCGERASLSLCVRARVCKIGERPSGRGCREEFFCRRAVAVLLAVTLTAACLPLRVHVVAAACLSS